MPLTEVAPEGPGVYLVGAGPGDPGLMTRRSLELIAAADAIVYDRLIPAGALAGARSDADLHYVGKQPGGQSTGQDEINELLVALGRAGRLVVRLKGGDPFVFGRGGEEARALVAAGVRFEVVPGISAGLAAPAYAGIPVTHRGDASAVALITGHEDPEKESSALDWPAIAAFPGSLVLYMGVENLAAIARSLIEAGRPPDQPVAVIEQGTLARQRTVTACLAEIAAATEQAAVRPPAVTVIGPVALLRDELAWFERRPLFGKTVVVTRARAQAGELAGRLRSLGADVIELPAIRIEPLPFDGDIAAAVERIGRYAIVCVVSPNGASLLLDAIAAAGADARALAGVTVAAGGPATATALRERGVRADIVPARAVAEELVEALVNTPVEGRRVLVARARDGRDLLPAALRERGADVDELALYRTVAAQVDDEQLQAVARADYVTFSSGSTVRFFLEAVGDRAQLPERVRLVSIGPLTSGVAREHGLTVALEARRHDIDGILEALVEDARR